MDTPATFSEVSGREGHPKTTGESSLEKKEPGKQQAQPGDESSPTAKQYVPLQVGKADDPTQTVAAAASYLSDPQGIKDTACRLSACGA
jgi:hypothetical protein